MGWWKDTKKSFKHHTGIDVGTAVGLVTLGSTVDYTSVGAAVSKEIQKEHERKRSIEAFNAAMSIKEKFAIRELGIKDKARIDSYWQGVEEIETATNEALYANTQQEAEVIANAAERGLVRQGIALGDDVTDQVRHTRNSIFNQAETNKKNLDTQDSQSREQIALQASQIAMETAKKIYNEKSMSDMLIDGTINSALGAIGQASSSFGYGNITQGMNVSSSPGGGYAIDAGTSEDTISDTRADLHLDRQNQFDIIQNTQTTRPVQSKLDTLMVENLKPVKRERGKGESLLNMEPVKRGNPLLKNKFRRR